MEIRLIDKFKGVIQKTIDIIKKKRTPEPFRADGESG